MVRVGRESLLYSSPNPTLTDNSRTESLFYRVVLATQVYQVRTRFLPTFVVPRVESIDPEIDPEDIGSTLPSCPLLICRSYVRIRRESHKSLRRSGYRL